MARTKTIKTPGSQLARIIATYDRVASSAEDVAQSRIESALDASYKQLEAELRRKWDKYSAENQPNLLGSQRSLLLLQEVKEYLKLFRPEQAKAIEKEFQALLKTSTEQGISMASELMGAIAGNSFVKSTASVNLDAVKFQAQNGMGRLSKHESEFASKASAIVEMSLTQGWGVGKAAGLMRRELGITKGKAEQIVRTESISALDSATRENYSRNGIDLVQRVATVDSRVCPYCAARAGNVYPLDKAPAAIHPNDRCYNMPFSRDWLEEGLIDTEWMAEHRKGVIELAGGTNDGLAPFEKLNGLDASPKPVWTVEGGMVAIDAKAKS